MSDTIQDPQGGAEPAVESTPQDAPQFDLNPVNDRINELHSRFEERFDALQQSLAPPAQEDADEWDPAAYYDEQQQFDPDRYAQLVEERAQKRAQELLDQRTSPLEQRLMAMEAQQNAQRLIAQYPELENPEIVREVGSRAQEQAQAIAFSLGLDETQAARLSRDPRVLEQAYKAYKFERAAAGEVPARPDIPEGEAAGGVAPASTEPESIISQIIQSRRGPGSGNIFGL